MGIGSMLFGSGGGKGTFEFQNTANLMSQVLGALYAQNPKMVEQFLSDPRNQETYKRMGYKNPQDFLQDLKGTASQFVGAKDFDPMLEQSQQAETLQGQTFADLLPLGHK